MGHAGLVRWIGCDGRVWLGEWVGGVRLGGRVSEPCGPGRRIGCGERVELPGSGRVRSGWASQAWLVRRELGRVGSGWVRLAEIGQVGWVGWATLAETGGWGRRG